MTLAEFCNARCDGSEQRIAAQFNEKYRYSKDWYYQLFSGRRFNRKLGKLHLRQLFTLTVVYDVEAELFI